MGRPAQLLDIGNPKNRVLRWVSDGGRHHRALYLEQRGQTLQARISGFGMRPKSWFPGGLVSLPAELLVIVSGWGPGWRVERSGGVKSSLPYAHIRAWLARTSPDAATLLYRVEPCDLPPGHVGRQLELGAVL